MFLILFSVTAILFALIYQYIRNKRKHFEDIGIEYDKAFPFIGTYKDVFFKRENLFDGLDTVYKKFNSG